MDIMEEREVSFPPAHTAEHLLNQLMIRMFGCERSHDAHVERKKSKITYRLENKPDRKVEREIERQMNELIDQDERLAVIPFAWLELATMMCVRASVSMCALPDR